MKTQERALYIDVYKEVSCNLKREHFENDIGEKTDKALSTIPPNSIERVRVVEQRAEEQISAAHNEAAVIINTAQKKAETLLIDSAKAAKEAAAGTAARLWQENRALMDALTVELDAETQAVKDAAMGRTAEVVELIYKVLV